MKSDIFLAFVNQHNLELPNNFLEKISEFCALLLETNKTTNLVSKNDSQKLLTRHVADSLIFAVYLKKPTPPFGHPSLEGNSQLSIACAPHSPPANCKVYGRLNSQLLWADIGSGAGFPVVPLCLYFPQTKFFAIENRKKRCEFLNLVKQKLNLQNLEIIQGTVGAAGVENFQFQQNTIDIVSCRAVGSLDDDFKLAKKLLKKGGCFLTLKTKRVIEDLKAKNNKLLSQATIFNYKLPKEEMEYVLVAIYPVKPQGLATPL